MGMTEAIDERNRWITIRQNDWYSNDNYNIVVKKRCDYFERFINTHLNSITQIKLV